jgi:hypothetical protein
MLRTMQFPESWEDNNYTFSKGNQNHLILGPYETLQKEYKYCLRKKNNKRENVGRAECPYNRSLWDAGPK